MQRREREKELQEDLQAVLSFGWNRKIIQFYVFLF